MYYIARDNVRGRTYLMSDGVFRPRPLYCKTPQSKYDLARARGWKSCLWHNNNRVIADNFVAYLMRGKRLSNKPFITESITTD